MITFETTLYSIGPRATAILRLPKEASAKLPSRNPVMVQGNVNNVPFKLPLEPDGDSSHWFEVNEELQREAKIKAGDTVQVSLEVIKDWPEPAVPTDWQAALDANDALHAFWVDITPLARHEWLRWINSTLQSETRQRRIRVSESKLMAGERRPCCFNRSMCCVPEVSKSGILLSPK